MEIKKVIVTGIGGNVGQGILRNIRDSFSDIYIVGLDVSNFTPGNYLCDKTYKVPYSYEENYVQAIQEIVEKENIEIILPSTDYEVYFLSLNRNMFNAKLVASEAKIAEIYLDKYKSYLFHKDNNIPFARSWLPEEYDFSEKDIIAKPREGRGSRGILINPQNPQNLPKDYIIQPLLKGNEITSAVYVTIDNKLHGVFTMERELTNGTTSKSKVVFEYDEQIREIARELINLGGFKGSFNIQSIVTEDNKIVPFEINCRISGTNSIRHNLGFQDVKYALEEYLYNKKPTKANPQKGIATRIYLDVIYPEAIDEVQLNNKTAIYKLY